MPPPSPRRPPAVGARLSVGWAGSGGGRPVGRGLHGEPWPSLVAEAGCAGRCRGRPPPPAHPPLPRSVRGTLLRCLCVLDSQTQMPGAGATRLRAAPFCALGKQPGRARRRTTTPTHSGRAGIGLPSSAVPSGPRHRTARGAHTPSGHRRPLYDSGGFRHFNPPTRIVPSDRRATRPRPTGAGAPTSPGVRRPAPSVLRLPFVRPFRLRALSPVSLRQRPFLSVG